MLEPVCNWKRLNFYVHKRCSRNGFYCNLNALLLLLVHNLNWPRTLNCLKLSFNRSFFGLSDSLSQFNTNTFNFLSSVINVTQIIFVFGICISMGTAIGQGTLFIYISLCMLFEFKFIFRINFIANQSKYFISYMKSAMINKNNKKVITNTIVLTISISAS